MDALLLVKIRFNCTIHTGFFKYVLFLCVSHFAMASNTLIIEVNDVGDFRRLVGEQIRLIRKNRGLTQTQLAERTGNDSMSKSRISDIENGKINISLDTLERLMNALDVTPSEFFNFQKIVNEEDYHEKKLLVDLHRQVLLERDLNEVKYVIRTTKDFLDTIDSKHK